MRNLLHDPRVIDNIDVPSGYQNIELGYTALHVICKNYADNPLAWHKRNPHQSPSVRMAQLLVKAGAYTAVKDICGLEPHEILQRKSAKHYEREEDTLNLLLDILLKPQRL